LTFKWHDKRARAEGKVMLKASLVETYPSGRRKVEAVIGERIALVFDPSTRDTTVYIANLPVVVVTEGLGVRLGQGMPTAAIADYFRECIKSGVVVIEPRAGVL
jgi:hypothetical protein